MSRCKPKPPNPSLAARPLNPCRSLSFRPPVLLPYSPTPLLPYSPTPLLPYTFSSRYSRSHGLITSMKVSNSARLIAV
ncbi:hypothetical protein EN802_29085 [bacterium M00.F.Ca.ET.159.01.1.1]|nr:hypothetical protein EN802_29085 [bacterium M00.F.Ca.ET.159.01.1.1]TGT80041.1 hypothetical protein EN800_28425 [bacterium M00.F.Ca.ET.157.01.1.1]